MTAFHFDVDGQRATMERFIEMAESRIAALPPTRRFRGQWALMYLRLAADTGDTAAAIMLAAALAEHWSGAGDLAAVIDRLTADGRQAFVTFDGAHITCRPQVAAFLDLWSDDRDTRDVGEVLAAVWGARRWDASAQSKYGRLQSNVNGVLAEHGVRDVFTREDRVVTRHRPAAK